jgi:hypothetical protein
MAPDTQTNFLSRKFLYMDFLKGRLRDLPQNHSVGGSVAVHQAPSFSYICR